MPGPRWALPAATAAGALMVAACAAATTTSADQASPAPSASAQPTRRPTPSPRPPGNPVLVTGNVYDASTGSPLGTASIAAFQDQTEVGQTTTNDFGVFNLALKANVGHRLRIALEDYATVSYEAVTPADATRLYLEPVRLLADAAASGSVRLTGFVGDAVSGGSLGGTIVTLREGINNWTGAGRASAYTQSNGAFYLTDVPAGTYTVEMNRPDFIREYRTLTVAGGATERLFGGTMVRSSRLTETRAILDWNGFTDLDLHVTGPATDSALLADGTVPRAHLYEDSTMQFLGFDLAMTLSGPQSNVEIATLFKQIPGIYRFSVHDESNQSSTTSNALARSEATIRLYRGPERLAVFHVPPDPEGSKGTLWKAFELEGGYVRPLNEVAFLDNGSYVQGLK